MSNVEELVVTSRTKDTVLIEVVGIVGINVLVDGLFENVTLLDLFLPPPLT